MAAVIENFFALLMGGDLESALALVDRNAEFVAARAEAPRSDDTMYGTYRGHDGVRDFVAKLGRLFEPQSFVVEEVLAGDGLEFASGRLCHRLRQTGRLFQSAWAVKVELADDRIRRYHFYEDTAALDAAMAGRPHP